MIYVIQKQLAIGSWIDARAEDGQPLWFPTKREAKEYIPSLGVGQYRIIRVKN